MHVCYYFKAATDKTAKRRMKGVVLVVPLCAVMCIFVHVCFRVQRKAS